jgi:hypothetical protein
MYFVPHAFASTVAFALMPLMMLSVAAAWSVRRCAAAVFLTLSLIVVIDGWMAPAAMYARSRDFIERLPEPYRAAATRQYAPLTEVIGLAIGSDSSLASAARLDLRDKAEMLAMAVSIAVLGAAVGAARRHSHAQPTLLTLTTWWLAIWVLYDALRYWSQYAVAMLSLSHSWQPWLTPVFFAALGVTAVRLSRFPGPPRRLTPGA